MSLLNTSLKIQNMELKNRLVMPPMAISKADENGKATSKTLAYYVEKSAGGYIGLIIAEHSYVSPEGKASKGQLSISDDSDIRGLQEIVSIVHKNDTKIMAQINHAGAATTPDVSGREQLSASATDIRTISGNWDQNLNTRIAVAAGGGGAGVRSKDDGYGGALVGGNGIGFREKDKRGMGGTQTEAGKKGGFGYGGTASPDGGGGGGGWYGGGAGDNDTGAGGGSSYISGYSGCAASPTGYVFQNAQMIAGNQSMPAPDGGYEVGHSGECRARIQLIYID